MPLENRNDLPKGMQGERTHLGSYRKVLPIHSTAEKIFWRISTFLLQFEVGCGIMKSIDDDKTNFIERITDGYIKYQNNATHEINI